MPQLAKQGIAEAIATFILTFIGAGAIVITQFAPGASNLVGIALAHGIALFVAVSATGHVSGGHVNPAVTIGFLITGRITPITAVVFIVSQLVGAVVAGFLLLAVFPDAAVTATNLGTPTLAPSISFGVGILIEIILTFILVFVVFQTAAHTLGPKAIAPLAIGFTIAADILAGGPLTGAAMNPARAFGPALAGGYWDDQLVYWIGPIIGGALAALAAHFVIQPGPEEPAAPGLAPVGDVGETSRAR
jgi:MIP family channel proteins